MTEPVLLRGVLPYGEGEPVDLLLRDGVIAELASRVDAGGARVVDAGGLVVLPRSAATRRCSRCPTPTRSRTPR
jgi:dihydroorotase-like cyclic amidohydrolase